LKLLSIPQVQLETSLIITFQVGITFKNLVIIIIIILLLLLFYFFWNSNQTSASIAGTEKLTNKRQIYCSFITPTSNFQVPERELSHTCRHINRQWCLLTSNENFPLSISLKDKTNQNQKSKLKKRVLENFASSNLDWYTPNLPHLSKKPKTKNKKTPHLGTHQTKV